MKRDQQEEHSSVRAKSYEKVKAEVDKADAAKKKAKKGEYAPSYAKKETDVTVYDDKPAAKKKAAPKPVAKKVVKELLLKLRRLNLRNQHLRKVYVIRLRVLTKQV